MSIVSTSPKVEKFVRPVPAIVEDAIAPHRPGRVQCQGSYWPARLYVPSCPAILLPDEEVRAIAREGISILVVPLCVNSLNELPPCVQVAENPPCDHCLCNLRNGVNSDLQLGIFI